MIRISHLSKEYEIAKPLQDVSVTINDGDVISIIGPSGTGKSTFLRCLNGLEKPTAGTIEIDGVDITDRKTAIDKVRRNVGMVFQDFNLFPHMTVIENIMTAPTSILRKNDREACAEAMKLLDTVGLSDRAWSYPDELSGGQKQRVAIARTLAMDPKVILFDEPTSALDPTMVGEVEDVIEKLAKSGRTLIIVTHSMKFARNVSNRVFYMDKGGIYEDGAPEQVFDHPQHERTRVFIEQLKVLSLVLQSDDCRADEIIEKIRNFAESNSMTPEFREKTESMLNGIVFELLMPNIRVSKRVRLLAEYSKETQTVELLIYYRDRAIDLMTVKEFGASVLFSGHVEEITQEKIDDDKYDYKIRLKIR